MICTRRRMVFCITLLVLNLAFIWGNSLLPGDVSRAFSQWVRSLLAFWTPSAPGTPGGHGLLRKIAHFTEFSCLGALFCWLIAMLKKKSYFSLIYSVLAACVDEFIQCFVPERGPGIRDVLIDTAGAALGIGLVLLGHTLYKKKKQYLLEENKQ